jgi:cyclin-dependent kinase regulatory subunit CKS1
VRREGARGAPRPAGAPWPGAPPERERRGELRAAACRGGRARVDNAALPLPGRPAFRSPASPRDSPGPPRPSPPANPRRRSHVTLPNELAKSLKGGRLLTELEWRQLHVQQSKGWVHYAIHRPEPHILLFRRELGTCVPQRRARAAAATARGASGPQAHNVGRPNLDSCPRHPSPARAGTRTRAR